MRRRATSGAPAGVEGTSMADSAEKEFERRMVAIYERAKTEAGYHATYFLRMLSEHGGVETARRLIGSSQPSDGFTTLYLKRRLDLTVEHLVLEEEFSSLFSVELTETARERLRSYGVER
jgi:hypothetical protein